MVAQPAVEPATTPTDVSFSSSINGDGSWFPSSWRSKVARQMPKYDDPALVDEVEGILSRQAPLVFAGEVLVCNVYGPSM